MCDGVKDCDYDSYLYKGWCCSSTQNEILQAMKKMKAGKPPGLAKKLLKTCGLLIVIERTLHIGKHVKTYWSWENVLNGEDQVYIN